MRYFIETKKDSIIKGMVISHDLKEFDDPCHFYSSDIYIFCAKTYNIQRSTRHLSGFKINNTNFYKEISKMIDDYNLKSRMNKLKKIK